MPSPLLLKTWLAEEPPSLAGGRARRLSGRPDGPPISLLELPDWDWVGSELHDLDRKGQSLSVY